MASLSRSRDSASRATSSPPTTRLSDTCTSTLSPIEGPPCLIGGECGNRVDWLHGIAADRHIDKECGVLRAAKVHAKREAHQVPEVLAVERGLLGEHLDGDVPHGVARRLVLGAVEVLPASSLELPGDVERDTSALECICGGDGAGEPVDVKALAPGVGNGTGNLKVLNNHGPENLRRHHQSELEPAPRRVAAVAPRLASVELYEVPVLVGVVPDVACAVVVLLEIDVASEQLALILTIEEVVPECRLPRKVGIKVGHSPLDPLSISPTSHGVRGPGAIPVLHSFYITPGYKTLGEEG